MTGRRGWPGLVVVAVLGVALTGITVLVVRRTEVRLASARLEESATSRADLLKRELDEAVLAVRGAARVIETVGPPDRARFAALAEPFLQHLPEIQAIEWLPRVERQDRARFEASLRRELGPGFEIFEQPEGTPRTRAGERDVYFPVLLAEPLAPNLTAVGFDLGSSPPRRQALERARDSGEAAASEAIRLVQQAGRDHDVGVLVFVPVFRPGAPVRTVAERRVAHLGYCVAVIHVEAMVTAAIVATPAIGLGFELVDGTDGGRRRLHRWVPHLPAPPRWTRLLYPEPPPVLRAIPFLNRSWEAEFSAAPAYVAAFHWQWHWLVPPVGLFLTVLMCLNMARRVTERRRLEQLVQARTAALAVSELRYRSIFENASEGIFQTSRDGRILRANLAFARMFGWESPDAIIAGIEDLGAQLYVDPGERARMLERVEREGRIQDAEIEARRRDGEHVRLVLNMHAVRDAGGALEYLEGTTTDVTARRRSEEALRQSQANLTAVMESTTEMIWSVDRDERLLTFNRAFAKYCRTTFGVEVRPGIFGGEHLPPEYYAAWSRLYQRAMQEGSFTLEHELPEHRFLALSLHPISEDGAVTGVSIFAKDVTEQKRLADQLNQAQKMEAIGTLAGGIAHDFNNILSAIKGYSELAASRSVDGEQADDLEQVRGAVDRAAELTKQILVFSRSSTAEARPIQPKTIVKEALKLLRASLPSTIEFRQELASDSVVLADPGEIHRIVVNLCTNAAHAMEEAGGVLQVRLDDVTLDAAYVASSPDVRPGRFLRLTVKDSGCGMTEEVRSRIFDPYFTTRSEGKGTGLGLSVVHGIVSKRHGTISVASEVGKGSTFQVLLPVDAEHLAALASREEEAPAMGTERVLFVDDEPMMANMAARSLGRLGYRVTAMSSSVDALARLRAAPQDFDIVITDMTMPHLTGDRLATAIRSFAPSLPIVLCTGFSERIDEERATHLEIDELVMKPVAGADLSRIVRRVLSARREGDRRARSASAPG